MLQKISIAVIFAIFLGSGCLAAGDWQNSLGPSGVELTSPQIDPGYQVWAVDTLHSQLRAWHPNGKEAPFSPLCEGCNSRGSTVSFRNIKGMAIAPSGPVYYALDLGTTGFLGSIQSWDGTPVTGYILPYLPASMDVDQKGFLYIAEENPEGVRAQFHVHDGKVGEYPGSPFSLSGKTAKDHSLIAVSPGGEKVYLYLPEEESIYCWTRQSPKGVLRYSSPVLWMKKAGALNQLDINKQGNLVLVSARDSSIRVYSASGKKEINIKTPKGFQALGAAFYPNGKVMFAAGKGKNNSLYRWAETNPLNIPILAYHNVTSSWICSHSMMVAPDDFADELAFLQRHGYHAITLNQLQDYLLYGKRLPSRPYALTFDDDYEGELRFGTTILSERKIPATFFIQVLTIGRPSYKVGLKGTWSQISAAEETGYIKVESHTLWHDNLAEDCSVSDDWEILTTSKTLLQQNLITHKCQYIAYPYGADSFTSETTSPRGTIPTIAACAGYEGAFCYAGGFASVTTPMYNLPRLMMTADDTLELFKERIGCKDPRLPGDPYIVDDNGNGEGKCTLEGDWSQASTNSKDDNGRYGATFALSTGKGTATFEPVLQKSGKYRVYAWWTPDSDRTEDALFTVHDAKGTHSFPVNQKKAGYRWNLLGEFTFAKERNPKVILSRNPNASGSLCADAVKWEIVR